MTRKSKRGQGEGSIRQRKDGTWEARYTNGFKPDGKPNRKSIYGKTRQEVSAKLTKIINEKNTGVFIEPSKMTLDSWLDTWLQEYVKQSVKLSTFISYETFKEKHIGPVLGNILIKDLRAEMIQKFYNDKLKDGRLDGKGGLSPKTIRNMHNMLHEALDQAYKNGLIAKNPSDATTLPKAKKKEMRVLSPQEQQKLLEAARNDRLGMAIVLALATGLRLGELLGLQWKDLEMKSGNLTVKRTINRLKSYDSNSKNKTAIVLQEPKTKNSQRKIPLQDVVLKQLKSYQKEQKAEKFKAGESYEDNDFVFCSPIGRPIEPRTFQDTFYRLIKEAGIENANFHSLRHTFATRALEAGIPSKTVSEILGHSSVAFTLDLYTHVSVDTKKEAMEKLSQLFE